MVYQELRVVVPKNTEYLEKKFVGCCSVLFCVPGSRVSDTGFSGKRKVRRVGVSERVGHYPCPLYALVHRQWRFAMPKHDFRRFASLSHL